MSLLKLGNKSLLLQRDIFHPYYLWSSRPRRPLELQRKQGTSQGFTFPPYTINVFLWLLYLQALYLSQFLFWSLWVSNGKTTIICIFFKIFVHLHQVLRGTWTFKKYRGLELRGLDSLTLRLIYMTLLDRFGWGHKKFSQLFLFPLIKHEIQ